MGGKDRAQISSSSSSSSSFTLQAGARPFNPSNFNNYQSPHSPPTSQPWNPANNGYYEYYVDNTHTMNEAQHYYPYHSYHSPMQDSFVRRTRENSPPPRKGETEAVTMSGQKIFLLPKAVNASRSSFLHLLSSAASS